MPMPEISFVGQGWTGDNHASCLNEILNLDGLTEFIASVAFVRRDGVNEIKANLARVASLSSFFVGIRNEITSIQGVEVLLETGAKVYAVDTARRNVLFHPKVFLSRNRTLARVLVGSANLTHSGLFNNFECGMHACFDLTNEVQGRKFRDFTQLIKGGIIQFPEHVFLLQKENLQQLLEEGRLEDETVKDVKVSSIKTGQPKRDNLGPIPIRFTPPPRKAYRRSSEGIVTQPEKGVSTPHPIDGYVFVWRSRGLKRRDLCIPTGPTTNQTGSMFWKKGDLEIDQFTYFRNEVFGELDWSFDPRPARAHHERSEANFTLMVKGVNLGSFKLRLSHNSKPSDAVVEQGNSVTQISWGDAKKHIASEDLLGRIMTLHKRSVPGGKPDFLLEID